MKKNLGFSVTLLLVSALIFMVVEWWLWARVLGTLFLILFPFSAWRRKSKGLSTIAWYLLIIVFVWAVLWLYPANTVNDATIVLLTILVIILSLWEQYKESQCRNRGLR